MSIKSVILLILGGLVILSCSNKKQEVNNLKSYLGDTIDFCGLKGSESLQKSNESNKILVFLDSVNCTTCSMDNIIMWDRHVADLRKYNLDIIVLCNHSNPYVINKYMLDFGIEYPVLLDSHNMLKKKYRFLENERYQTFVVNSDNKIIWIGSPIMKKEYWESFCKMMELMRKSKKS